MSPARWALVAAVAALLAGCAVPRMPGPAEDQEAAAGAYRERAARLAELAGWQLDGRVVVKGPGESGQARIRWSRSSGEGRLAVRNPFGQTVLEVRRDRDGLSLRDARGGMYRGNEVHAVLQRRLGWRVPLGRLARWALGLGRENRVPADLDDRGRPRHLRVGPWTVAYTEYERVDGLWLPTAMAVTRGETALRIRVDRWQLDWSSNTEAQAT